MSAGEYGAAAAELLARIRARRPLVHHVTNLVVMNDIANVTLQLGASPVMAHAREEAADMAGVADALLLNQGTLEPAWVEAMLLAGRRAAGRGIPVVLDPVGAGATPYRTRTAHRLLDELTLAVVRGNAGEIGTLAGAGGTVRGVDSASEMPDPARVARTAAARWRTVVAITGARDVVSDGTRTLAVDGGHPWLTRLTGTGCMASAAVAAFAAVADDALLAAASALACYALAAERAAADSRGPGTFRAALLDALYLMEPGDLGRGARITELPGEA